MTRATPQLTKISSHRQHEIIWATTNLTCNTSSLRLKVPSSIRSSILCQPGYQSSRINIKKRTIHKVTEVRRINTARCRIAQPCISVTTFKLNDFRHTIVHHSHDRRGRKYHFETSVFFFFCFMTPGLIFVEGRNKWLEKEENK